MSHTIKTQAGNKKLKGLAAQERANQNKQQRKAERSRREARKRSHEQS